jgi:Caspase domain
MSKPNSQQTNLHALLIGIDCYLPNRLPDGGSYLSLKGCVRDISHVENFLLHSIGMPPENILKITSSNNTTSDKPLEPQDKWPTYENIVDAFKKITDSAKAGDQVYIHYSGHGGRANTNYRELKGEQGLDETLVPLDIGNSEARYLRDIELAHILKTMVDKGLVVTIILDSCHSGGATRALRDAKGSEVMKGVDIRGISNVDTTTRPKDSLVASNEELIKSWQGLSKRDTTRGFEMQSGWLPQPNGYVLIAACKPSESAHEAEFEGNERNGALTYWLLKSLKNIGPGLTYRQIHNRVITKIHSQFPQQTPMLEGEDAREVFGSKGSKFVYAVNVMSVDTEKKRILLNAGEVHGLQQGSQFAIYPAGLTDFADIDKRIAIVEIDELRATDSWAKLISEFFPNQKIDEGSQAILIDSGNVVLKKSVRLVLPREDDDTKIPLSSLKQQKEALNKIRDSIPETGKGFMMLAEDDKKADYQVAINSKGEYEIWDPAGIPIEHLRPPIKIEENNAAERVVKRLVHLINYNNVQQLDNTDITSPLSNKLAVELYGLSDDYDPRKRPTSNQLVPLDTLGNIKEVKKGQKLALRIQNTLPKIHHSPEKNVLNITMLDLQPDWGIQQVYPNPADSDYMPLDPQADAIIPFGASLPPEYGIGKDLLKVFATIEPTNFRWLELPALDQAATRVAPTLRSVRKPANQLEKLMSDMTDATRGLDLLTPTSYASRGWATAQIEIQIKS